MQYRTYINTDGVTGVDARTDRQTDGRVDRQTDTTKALILLGLEYFTIDFYLYFGVLFTAVSQSVGYIPKFNVSNDIDQDELTGINLDQC